jgi:hypothetical protein
VSEPKIRERPPLTLRNIDGGPLGGVGADDTGASTIKIKNIDGRPPGGAGADDLGAPTINVKNVNGGPPGRCRS